MTTAFEFLDHDTRRIAFPRLTILACAVALMVFVSLDHFAGKSLQTAHNELANVVAELDREIATLVDEARKNLPDDSEIADLELHIHRHNAAVGGGRSAWTQLFNLLEAVLPPSAVLLSLDNPKHNKPLFSAEDRDFRIAIELADGAEANELFARLSSIPAITALNFTPRMSRVVAPAGRQKPLSTTSEKGKWNAWPEPGTMPGMPPNTALASASAASTEIATNTGAEIAMGVATKTAGVASVGAKTRANADVTRVLELGKALQVDIVFRYNELLNE